MTDSTIPEVDRYLAKAPEFARPILEKLRKAAHKASPEIGEAMKWGAPHFVQRGILAGMVAFKGHVSFYFWHGREMEDPIGLFADVPAGKMCGIKISSLKEVPSQKVLVGYFKQALELDGGVAGSCARKAGRRSRPESSSFPTTSPPNWRRLETSGPPRRSKPSARVAGRTTWSGSRTPSARRRGPSA